MGQDRAECVMDLSASLSRVIRNQRDVVCPHKRRVRDGGTDHGSIDPFCDSRTWSPVATGGTQKGIEKTFSPSCLQQHMVVPPQSAVERKAQILGAKTVGDGMSVNSNGSRWDSAGTCKEHSLSLRRVKGEATGGTPPNQKIHSTLNTVHKCGRVIPAAQYSAVVREGNSYSVIIVYEMDRLIEG